MRKRMLVVSLGLMMGAGLIVQDFGAARAFAQTLEATRPRQAVAAAPAAEATVILNEQFLNSLLEVMFTRLRAPSYPLSLSALEGKAAPSTATHKQSPAAGKALNSLNATSDCASVVVLEREMDGVKTAVRFENGRIVAPLAFTGSYNTGLLGCMRFRGWADTNINLEFDRTRQTLSARVEVVDIHVSGLPLMGNGMILDLVQSSIDQRINPVEILKTEQLTARVPISAAGGALRLRAKELRPEIVPGFLRLHIIYEFEPQQ
ncbi:MAG: hypothetical protein WCF57_10140 [Pyrinomonadaceae bacterium]